MKYIITFIHTPILVYLVFLPLALSKTKVVGDRIEYSVGPYTNFVQAYAPKCEAINSKILTHELLIPYLKSQNVDEETIDLIMEVLFVKKKNFYTFESKVHLDTVHLRLISGTAERFDDDSFKISLAKGEISGKLQEKTQVITMCKTKRKFLRKKKKCHDENLALALNADEIGRAQNHLHSLLRDECLNQVLRISRNEL